MTNDQKSLARTSAYSDASPMARWLGFSVAMEGDEAIYSLAFDDKHIGNAMIRALHGGAIAAFLEFSAQCALRTRLGEGAAIATVNADIDYLRSSRAEDMKARVTILRAGRRMAFVEATGWQQDETKPVATARFRISVQSGANANKA